MMDVTFRDVTRSAEIAGVHLTSHPGDHGQVFEKTIEIRPFSNGRGLELTIPTGSYELVAVIELRDALTLLINQCEGDT